jgi:predicted Zn-dependent protease
MIRKSAIAAFALFVFLFSCSRVPITNRKQVHLLSASDINSMAISQYQQTLQQSKLVTGTPDAQLVEKVGKNISNAAVELMKQLNQSHRIAGFQWEYHLLESKEVNAWCLPGGKIAVYTGLLPITKDEAGLAVVMGHEVGHALAEHGNERMSQALIAEMGGMALDVALSEQPQQTRDLYGQAYGLGAHYGALLPFSRAQETEADKIGLVLMAVAGYDLNAAVSLWERMKQKSAGQAPPEFMSTHPSDQRRIDDIKAFMPEAMKYVKK